MSSVPFTYACKPYTPLQDVPSHPHATKRHSRSATGTATYLHSTPTHNTTHKATPQVRKRAIPLQREWRATRSRDWATPMSQEEERKGMRQNHALTLMMSSRVNSTPHKSSFGSSYQYCQLRLRAHTKKETNKPPTSLVCLPVSSSTCAKSKEEYDVCAQCEYYGTKNLGNVVREVYCKYNGFPTFSVWKRGEGVADWLQDMNVLQTRKLRYCRGRSLPSPLVVPDCSFHVG
jgi:hypothetical protein